MKIFTLSRRVIAGVTAGAVALGALVATQAPASATTDGKRGQLVSTRYISGLSTSQTKTALDQAHFDSDAVTYGVDAYQLVYSTIDATGQPTTASGLLVLPRSRARTLWTVSFDHGTQSYRPDAPSMMQPDGFASSPAITYAAAGFAAVEPDYLGLGVGPGTHPWMDVPSETTASLDMLRAARAFVQSTGRRLAPQVMITGFSQGASAALGLARAIQSGADHRFRVAALAPISGAYDFQHSALPAAFDGRIPGKMAVAYTTYLLVAWNRLHHLYATPGELFQDPYAGRVEALFDGNTPGEDMLAALPDTVGQLLTARGVDLLQHPTGPFLAALRVADSVCTDWTPRVPMRLYEATDDEQALTTNTDSCHAALAARGLEVPIVNLGTPDYDGSRHLGSAVAGTAATVRWFGQLHERG
ncbi:lipase [Amycolatopsis cynarae]|uniref:Lipase n=1 Tax=Amycolatopsis cynarae TaxID=2995223 RepID=A0ABY7B5T1_9PSEU|nr:lipase family protein [Amycolatopsis sp. HUAS 11-8]WAL66143.1 lipase [Amycolatopsis sp. HUAS 11-8]